MIKTYYICLICGREYANNKFIQNKSFFEINKHFCTALRKFKKEVKDSERQLLIKFVMKNIVYQNNQNLNKIKKIMKG